MHRTQPPIHRHRVASAFAFAWMGLLATALSLATSARAAPDDPKVPTFAEVLVWLETERDASPQLETGAILRRADLPRIETLVPPGIFAELDFDDFEARVQATESFGAHSVYQSASMQYGGQNEIGADGSLQNYVAGRPFSNARIRAAPPDEAPLMVAWNYIYRWQHYGYASDEIHFAFLRPGASAGRNANNEGVLVGGAIVERHLVERFQRVYLTHVASEADNDYKLDVDDAGSLHYKDYLSFTDPFEMRGNTFVIERPVDPHERDQVNSYLATERRVRRLSPKERADSFVGSEFTLDDFEGFSGRVLDYAWTYHGERKILHVADGVERTPVFNGPHSRIPVDQWQVRDTHVIEQRPTLSEHTYKRSLLFIDAERSTIAYKLIFDQDDRLLKIIYPLYHWPLEAGELASVEPRETVSHWMGNVAINVQTDAASLVWGAVEIPDVKPSEVRRLFSVSNLNAGR